MTDIALFRRAFTIKISTFSLAYGVNSILVKNPLGFFFEEFDKVILKSTWEFFIHRIAKVIHD